MTKIIFDVQRDNGYGKNVYLPGELIISPIQNSTTNQRPNMSLKLGGGAVEFELEPTSEYLLWAVTERVSTSGGSLLSFQRTVSVPDSLTPVDYLDLEDVEPIVIHENA